MFTSSSMVSNCGTHLKLSSQDQRRGHLHSYNVYLLLVYLTIVISPGPFDQEDEEEGIKEERGDADRYVSVVFAGLPTHTVTLVRGIICRCLTCGSYVRPLRGLHSHSMLCLAPINTTPGLLSLYSVAWWQLGLFLASEEKKFFKLEFKFRYSK